jgi:hypothetical protein
MAWAPQKVFVVKAKYPVKSRFNDRCQSIKSCVSETNNCFVAPTRAGQANRKGAAKLGGPSPQTDINRSGIRWRSTAMRLQMMFEGRDIVLGKEYKWPEPQAQWKGDIGIYLVPDKNKRPVLALRPTDLQSALILYAARMIATGTTFNICGHSKTPFLSGGTRFRTKRGDARFCSSECRWKWHNELRRKAR